MNGHFTLDLTDIQSSYTRNTIKVYFDFDYLFIAFIILLLFATFLFIPPVMLSKDAYRHVHVWLAVNKTNVLFKNI